MFRRLVALGLIAALAAVGCKKKSTDPDPAGDDAAAGASATAPTAPAPVDPDPYFKADPEPEVATADAAPLPTAPISESGAEVFSAGERSSVAVTWTVDATELQFSPVVIGARPDSSDVQVVMSSGGRSQQISTCRGLSTAGGSVTAYQRGDGTAFIACFTRADSSDKGRSWGVRIRWNVDTRIAEVAGNWQNDGPPAFDTMDFDEKPDQ
jgi:hypothetical protein